MPTFVENRINCPHCASPLSPDLFWAEAGSRCHQCGLIMQGKLFRRFLNPHGGQGLPNPVSSHNESSCFFHPDKQALTHCEKCGRFICALCELPIEGKIVCPVCFERMDMAEGMKTFTHQVIFWDSIVLTLALFPILALPVTLITAPVTLVLIFRHFKAPQNYIFPRSRWRFYVGGTVAICQMIGWGFLLLRALI